MNRIVFFGTSVFAVAALSKLIDAGYHIAAVVTQPDRKIGRNQLVTYGPIKTFSISKGLNVIQPEKIKKNGEFFKQLNDFNADIFIVAAYGNIIPDEILKIPRYGSLNIHGSILPKYRGASPIQTALLNGDAVSGVSIIVMDAGMDTGDIIATCEVQIFQNDTFATLENRLASAGSELLCKILPRYLDGLAASTKQNNDIASYTKIISRDDGRIHWDMSAVQINNQYRAYDPWPGCFCYMKDKRLKLSNLTLIDDIENKRIKKYISDIEPGKIYIVEDRLFAGCGNQDIIEIKSLQIEGKRLLTAKEFIIGLKSHDPISLS